MPHALKPLLITDLSGTLPKSRDLRVISQTGKGLIFLFFMQYPQRKYAISRKARPHSFKTPFIVCEPPNITQVLADVC